MGSIRIQKAGFRNLLGKKAPGHILQRTDIGGLRIQRAGGGEGSDLWQGLRARPEALLLSASDDSRR